ncbi:hypothetical protein B484DRAFT_411992, partial [Ochromonadaceae sp. CCMP2298]
VGHWLQVSFDAADRAAPPEPTGHGMDPPQPPRCTSNHEMPLVHTGNGWRCDLCSSRSRDSSQTDRYRCAPCDLDLCLDCYDSSGGNRGTPLCQGDHPMPLTMCKPGHQ